MATAEAIEQRRRDAIETAKSVEDAIVTLQTDRQTFSRFRDGVSRSEAVRQTHFPADAVARWYSQSTLVGLRRLDDRDKKSRSLRQLFERIIAHPEDWSYDAVCALWPRRSNRMEPTRSDEIAEATYGWIADASGRAVNVAQVESDRDALGTALAKARSVVDKPIAHDDSSAAAGDTITWAELDQAIYECERSAKRYLALLTGRGFALERGSMTPTEQTLWYRIFEAWEHLDPGSFGLPGVSC